MSGGALVGGEKRVVSLSPAQGRLARVLRERKAFLIRRGVRGWGFSSPVAEMAWGKALREDTVLTLVAAGVLVEKRVGRVRVELHLVEMGDVCGVG